MEAKIKKLQKMITDVAKHSILKINHSSTEDIDEITTDELEYNFTFSIKTDDNAKIRDIRSLVRTMINQAKYLSKKYEYFIEVDNSEYERCPVLKKTDGYLKDYTGFIRGSLSITIIRYDGCHDDASELYRELSI